jgi:uncharacterized membrane protein
MSKNESSELQRGFERLVNFSDAVVAIAATLLILPLVDIARPVGPNGVREIFAEHRYELLSFVLSFTVVCRLWLLHHRFYRNLRGYSSALIWANFLWLISIVFLPFATKLLAAGDGFEADTSGLYIGTIAVAVTAMLIQRIVVSRAPELEFDDARGATQVRPAVVATVVAWAAFVLAILFVHVGVLFLFLFTISGVVSEFVRRPLRRRVRHR